MEMTTSEQFTLIHNTINSLNWPFIEKVYELIAIETNTPIVKRKEIIKELTSLISSMMDKDIWETELTYWIIRWDSGTEDTEPYLQIIFAPHQTINNPALKNKQTIIENLKMQLQNALNEEDYIMAQKIQNELNNLDS